MLLPLWVRGKGNQRERAFTLIRLFWKPLKLMATRSWSGLCTGAAKEAEILVVIKSKLRAQSTGDPGDGQKPSPAGLEVKSYLWDW